MNTTTDPSEEDIYLTKSLLVSNPDDLKRQKLSDLAPPIVDTSALETLERFESISEYLSPEFMKEQRLAYRLNAMSQILAQSFMTLQE